MSGRRHLLRLVPGRARRDPAVRQARDHCADRAIGVRQVDRPTLLEPDERPDPRSAHHRHRLLPRAGHLRPEVDPIEVRRRIGMVFQKPNPFPKSIYDNVAYGPRVTGMKGDKALDDGRAGAPLGPPCGTRSRTSSSSPALGLSGGQQQRLCIARTIAVRPEVTLMDEPCSALDPIATARIEDLIDRTEGATTRSSSSPTTCSRRPASRSARRSSPPPPPASRASWSRSATPRDLQQPQGEGHRGLHLRPVRLIRAWSAAPPVPPPGCGLSCRPADSTGPGLRPPRT